MNIPTHGPILPEEVYAASGEVLALEGKEELPTSKRLHGCIKASGCKRVWEICIKTEKEWLVEKNFGRVSLRELKEILAKMGLSLDMRQQILTWRYFLPTGK